MQLASVFVMYRKTLVHVFLGLASSFASTALFNSARAASMINVELPYDKYGKESNIGGRCGATSMINSFVYLNNISPNLYASTNLLTGAGIDQNNDGSVDLKDSIIELDNLMGGAGCGTTDQGTWEGKLDWFDKYAPNTTTFAGMIDLDFSGWDGSQYLKRGNPTIDFLLAELRAGEDIEIGLTFAEGDGHWVTLTSMHIDDLNMNGIWDYDLSETASIDYIDPNCPLGTDANNPGPSLVPLSVVNGVLEFGWVNGNGTVCDTNSQPLQAQITVAYSESPVQVPAPFPLLGAPITFFWARRLRCRISRTVLSEPRPSLVKL